MKTVIAFRTFEDEQFSEQSESIHTPSNGCEVYKGQQITAEIEIASSGRLLSDLKVFRISPMGIELDVSDVEAAKSLAVGSELNISVLISKQKCLFSGLVVATAYTISQRSILGIRWVTNVQDSKYEQDRRNSPRWLSGEEFMPTGVAPNPALFNDFVYFKVADISKDGLQLITSLRNKFLIPEMILDSTVSFPLVGQVHLKFRIKNARTRTINGKEQLCLGVQVLNHDKPSLEVLGQYVLQFGPPLTVKELKKHGMAIQSTEKAFSFGFVKTADEYKSVLEFRKSAYGQVGKFDDQKDWEETGDQFDVKSRIITVHHHGKLVGSARLAFHSPDESCEYDEFVKFPKDFPRKTEMVVASRVCTHPDYRGSDLVYSLIKQIYLVALQAKRKYVLGGSSDALLPFYQKLGFQGTGLFFEHGALNKIKEQVVLGDASKILLGENCSFNTWNKYFRDLSEYVVTNCDLEIDPKTKVKFAAFQIMSKIRHPFSST